MLLELKAILITSQKEKLETYDLKLDRPFLLQHDKELADLCLCFSALFKVTFLSDEIEYRTDNI